MSRKSNGVGNRFTFFYLDEINSNYFSYFVKSFFRSRNYVKVSSSETAMDPPGVRVITPSGEPDGSQTG